MLLFRSEEHIERWVEAGRAPRGAILTMAQLWGLASVWYHDRLSADWRRRTAQEAQDVFASLGLTGDFWRLT
jgi:hypothetical protein